MRVIIVGSYSESDQERLRTLARPAELVFGDNPEAVQDSLADADGLVGSFPGALLERAPRLRWVHSMAAGVDKALTPEIRASEVILTSSAGNGGIPLAEHAMMLMLMLNRSAPRWFASQQNHSWDRFTHGELNGQTLGIVGLGNAGSDLALKAKAFHMRVLGVRRRTDHPAPNVDRLYSAGELTDFLAGCDFVVVTAPYTDETANMFDHAAFAAMKPTAFFICISRGGIADDQALLEALQRGTIAGAGLDAHGVEPLPSASPFWDLPNVIITPHNGATTAATTRRGFEIMAANLERFVQGQPLLNVVDKEAGY